MQATSATAMGARIDPSRKGARAGMGASSGTGEVSWNSMGGFYRRAPALETPERGGRGKAADLFLAPAGLSLEAMESTPTSFGTRALPCALAFLASFGIFAV